MATYTTPVCFALVERLAALGCRCSRRGSLALKDMAGLVLLAREVTECEVQVGADPAAKAVLKREIQRFCSKMMPPAALKLHGGKCPVLFLDLVINHFSGAGLSKDDVARIAEAVQGKLDSKPRASAACTLRGAKKRKANTDARGLYAESTPASTDASKRAKGPTVDERIAEFQGMNEHELKLCLLKLQDEREAAYDVCRNLRNKLARADSLVAKLADKAQQLKALEAQVKFRRGLKGHVPSSKGYLLAIKRSRGHAGAALTADLVGGEEEQGSLKDAHTVLNWENRLSVAKALKAMNVYADADGQTSADFHTAQFDATKQEAIDREKVHVSTVTSSHIITDGGAGADPAGERAAFDKADFEGRVLTTDAAGDLQIVHEGTGAETYSLVLREFASVGAPSWEARALEASQEAEGGDQRFSTFLFGTDQGPDNVGMNGRVRTALAAVLYVMFVWVYCLFHAGHNQCKSLVKVLNNWKWTVSHRSGGEG